MSIDMPTGLVSTGMRVVVFGGGPSSARFVAECVNVGAVVHLVAPWACSDLAELHAEQRITWSKRTHRPGDVIGVGVVFAAAEHPTNLRVQAEARRRKVLFLRDDHLARHDGLGGIPHQRDA